MLLACTPQPAETMNTKDVLTANNALYSSLNAMFEGDFGPISNVWSHSDSITYMGPFGGKLVGWEAVGADFKQVTDMKIGGSIRPEGVSVHVGEGMAYVACTEVGENIGPDGKPVQVRHRATNVFQLEGGVWKLIHHHTDIAEQLETAYDKNLD
jgi:ketosteroid isomerase-like protein